MYVVSTNTSLWGEKNTAVRIEFEDEAKREADAWSGPNEQMLDRCTWRLISNRWEEIEGDAVCFAVSLEEVLKLLGELRAIDGVPS